MNQFAEPLAERKLTHKTDAICWDKVPTTPCEMNFRRLELPNGSSNATDFAWLFVSVPVASSLIIYIAARLTGPLLLSHLSFDRVLLAATAFAVWVVARWVILMRTRPSRPQMWDLIRFAAFFVAYFIVVAVDFLVLPTGPLAVYLCLAVPMLIWLSDRFTSHIVYWMSAHPKLDYVTMRKWRATWRGRFKALEKMDSSTAIDEQQAALYRDAILSQNQYVFRLYWLALALALPVIIQLMIWKALGSSVAIALIPLEIIALLLLLFFAADTADCKLTASLFGRYFSHWVCHGKQEGRAPWEFQSPAGKRGQRMAASVLVLVLLTVSLVPLVQFDPVDAYLGNGIPFATVLGTLACLAVVPPAVFLLSLLSVAGPTVRALHALLECESAPEHQPGLQALDGFNDRLAKSANELEKDSIVMGINPDHHYPVLLSADLLFEHMHVLGATGSSKTSLGLTPLVNALIARNDGAVIVIDGKGDNAFFHTVRENSRQAGRTFKWFTNKPNKSTYVFNPFGQSYLERMSMKDIGGLFMASLNMNHGDDYGRAYFSMGARQTFQTALKRSLGRPHGRRRRGRRNQATPRPILSFADLRETIEETAVTPEDQKAAQHLAFVAQSLADFEQLNMSPTRHVKKSALDNAIHMPDVIANKEAAYFYLSAAIDISSVAEIARLVIYSVLSAAIDHRERTGQPPKVYVVIDEAQTVIAQNIGNVLAQAREHGVACILAHQSLSQLNPPGGVDLRELVLSCTAVKQFFSARDPMLKDYISKLSGEVGYYNASWKQLKRRVGMGPQYISRRFACGTNLDGYPINISEQVGPRLLANDIEAYSRDPNASIVTVERHHGYSLFEGAFPITTPWPMDYQLYEQRRTATPWPADDAETIEVKTDWPEANEHTVTSQSHPAPAFEPGKAEVKLDAIFDKLNQ